MGHAHYHNISEYFIRHLYCKGKLSMKDLLAAMRENDVRVRASCGTYDEFYLMDMGIQSVLGFQSHV